jgi:hypothetical protein
MDTIHNFPPYFLKIHSNILSPPLRERYFDLRTLLHGVGLVIGGSSEKIVDWRQCAAVMQGEAVTYAKL